jgi:hypothetical protein
MALILKSDQATTDSTLPYLEADAIINTGTKFVFDFADPSCWAAQRAPLNNETFVNLVRGGNVATAVVPATQSIGFVNGGLVSSAASAGERVLLPVEAKLATTTQSFLFAVWIKHNATQLAGALHAVAGWANNQLGADNVYSMAYNATIGRYEFFLNGAGSVYVPTGDGQIIQMVMGLIKVGSLYYRRLYINGARQGADVLIAYTALNQTTNSSPQLGFVGGHVNDWNGTIYRSWLEDTGLSGANPDTQVALDYAENSARFV